MCSVNHQILRKLLFRGVSIQEDIRQYFICLSIFISLHNSIQITLFQSWYSYKRGIWNPASVLSSQPLYAISPVPVERHLLYAIKTWGWWQTFQWKAGLRRRETIICQSDGCEIEYGKLRRCLPMFTLHAGKLGIDLGIKCKGFDLNQGNNYSCPSGWWTA